MKKLFFLIQTFMFFFVIFIIKNIEFIFVDFNTANVLSNVLKITDIIFIMCIIISDIVIIYFKKNIDGAKKIPSKVMEVKQEKDASLIFFATYILPLVTIDIKNISEFFAFTTIMILMFILCWKTELWYTNPILVILGYKIYKIKCENEICEGTIISRENIKVADYIDKKKITDEVLYARKR